MKKIISMLLVLTILISTLSLSSAINVNAATINNESDNYYSEAFESEGVQYFFEDTAEYTITITQALTGEKTITFKDKLSSENNQILYYTDIEDSEEIDFDYNTSFSTNKEVEISGLSNSEILELIEVKNQTLNSKIKLERIDIQKIAQEINMGNSSPIELTSANKVYQALAAEYGSQYTFSFLGSLTRRGHTGELYQHRTFAANRQTSLLFDVLTGVGIVATFYGVPTKAILKIAAWVSAGAAGYQLLKPTSFTDWNATVHIQKEVKIGNQYPYRAFYDRHLNAVTGNMGTAALSDIKRTSRSNDFNNNNAILTKGIDLYIGY